MLLSQKIVAVLDDFVDFDKFGDFDKFEEFKNFHEIDFDDFGQKHNSLKKSIEAAAGLGLVVF